MTTIRFHWPFYRTLIPHVIWNDHRSRNFFFWNFLRLFSVFFDIPAIINNLDYVVLPSFDFQTPARNPKEADYSAPLYELNERIKESNVNSQVLYWLGQHAPASKLIVGIPAFGRTWKLEEDNTQTGVPPILGVMIVDGWYRTIQLTECFVHLLGTRTGTGRHSNENSRTVELSRNLCQTAESKQ